MKLESRIYVGVGVFFVLVVVIYFLWSGDSGNSIFLVASALLGIMPGLYLGWWSRRMSPRPEDREDVSLEEIEGAVGYFPSYTIWPFVLGIGVFLTALAFVFGAWTAVIGMGFVISAAIGGTLSSKPKAMAHR
ncbi:Cytochrome c oxidase subunit IV [Ferrithrix thermotolerans DSM 19514]|jgi:uncharacterized membrane protein|uniref:cytochrome-c oxidase n=1 Tax=Ferrithrix thermotolerans DSM 19514 TaxID=1121881 RepID=A0A1M4VBW2_9ACTN|nr:cytochrome c oxidase subunit 4 [Ferrithrix thermotolerans]SHE66417.1 Cytochrome c oxidase subunit IV [Ferrithrix thermotolerans DSM 19514]